jgi:hypothetical protein
MLLHGDEAEMSASLKERMNGSHSVLIADYLITEGI